MGIAILLIFIFLFEFRLKKYSFKFKIQMHSILLIYIVFSFILNNYLEYAYNWENGVPGADLTAYFNVAKSISEGTGFHELYKIDYRFVYGISGIGYILYATFVALVSFLPVIISTKFSLYILYIIQCIIAIISAINLSEFFKNSKKEKRIALFVFLTCVCVSQMSSVLMRDIWIVFFISILVYKGKKENPNKVLGIIITLLCFLLRSYTVFITIPFFVLYYLQKKKAAVIASFTIFAIFIIGQGIISNISSVYNIEWNYEFNFNVDSIIKFILFPNIISQTSNVQNMITGYHVKFGGNTEWIYYLLSCWNLYVYPIVGYGIIKSFKEKKGREEKFIFLFQIINISLLYSIFYNSVSEPRHKLLILYGLIYFFISGYSKIDQKYTIIYLTIITLIIFLLFLLII